VRIALDGVQLIRYQDNQKSLSHLHHDCPRVTYLHTLRGLQICTRRSIQGRFFHSWESRRLREACRLLVLLILTLTDNDDSSQIFHGLRVEDNNAHAILGAFRAASYSFVLIISTAHSMVICWRSQGFHCYPQLQRDRCKVSASLRGKQSERSRHGACYF